MTGRKGIAYFRFRERPVEAELAGVLRDARPTTTRRRSADAVIEAFMEREVDEIHGVFTDYVRR